MRRFTRTFNFNNKLGSCSILLFSPPVRQHMFEISKLFVYDPRITRSYRFIYESAYTKLKLINNSSIEKGNRVRSQSRAGVGWGGHLEKLAGVWGPLPKTLTLFMTKICDIPCPNL